MNDREPPVEVVGYEHAFLPTLNLVTGEVQMRWWSIKKGLLSPDLDDPATLMIPLWQ